ncbi:CBS domain-containing protein [Singulisphaera sp. PoT]|uniref:CBS domain-containing protein n=1 Tax=Singulisphaera sp. PoT TaxID=3411797 RepID=UPI003BF4F259
MGASDSTRSTAADVMTSAPRTCSIFSTVLEAVLIFRDANCVAVPVLDNGKAVGIVTDRDVALALPEYRAKLDELPVSELMSKGVPSVAPETPVEEVLEKMNEAGYGRLLVVDAEEQLLGIISLVDLAPHVSTRALGETVTEVIEKA